MDEEYKMIKFTREQYTNYEPTIDDDIYNDERIKRSKNDKSFKRDELEQFRGKDNKYRKFNILSLFTVKRSRRKY